MKKSPEAKAWRVLLIFFSIFLILLGLAGYGVYWFVFKSVVPMEVELTTTRGTVRAVFPNTEEEFAITGRREELEVGVEIRTDSTSQATLAIIDPKSSETVAMITLLSDSRIRLTDAYAPRFRFHSGDTYQVIADDAQGQTDVRILPGWETGNVFSLSTTLAQIEMTEPGHYVVYTNGTTTSMTTRAGYGELHDHASNQIAIVEPNIRAQVTAGQEGVSLTSAETSLLVNGDFSDDITVGWDELSDGENPGSASTMMIDGREALVIDRSQENWPGVQLDHGELGFLQQPEIDVSEYSYLELQASFYVEEQSLPTCGVAGSECPLMIRIAYEDPQGVQREIIQGFYAYRNPAINAPLRCDTCTSDHQHINIQSWYTYHSGNLFTLLPPEQRPVKINQVWFYASGHAYKVYISDLELLTAP